ncbi:NAD/NADP-dependent octopine/nopaline dehydrogenase family protein [Acetomicrobium sp. S15 = DSM 107314]|uniref:NAD/NADP-dependent octopine/nopaline dehydrogenase family protein n=1 Tax=Acetomicrobium sp. S15 = DSM 107314 TaxID=2529858 RepID=UPI0018E1597C|nr:NAD/NADP-dependent octopine/nopaline dehydrogenase family protein [Acetomicrobium sp. S15 = DSM 107314]
MSLKVAVLGAGNGGLAMGAHLALMGCNVKIYDKFPEAVKPLQKEGGVHLKSAFVNGFGPLESATSSIEEAIAGCDLIMVVTPAFAHREIAQSCVPLLRDGQKIILHPGRTGGAMEFYHILSKKAPGLDVIVTETQTLVYACRRTGPSEVTIYGVKERVPLAAIPAFKTKEVIALLKDFYPQFTEAQNVLETSLLNMGAIFHPTPTIFNLGRIEEGQEFEYYHQGITPLVGRVLDKIDQERVAIAESLGLSNLTALEWLRSVYGIEINKGDDICSAIHKTKVYAGIMAPKDPYTRYLTEDVPMSLVPLSELAKIANIKTPIVDLIIEIASTIHEKDYRSSGRTLGRMGVQGLSKYALLEYVNSGIR